MENKTDEAPQVEVIEVEVEKGFATSPILGLRVKTSHSVPEQ